jgi:hypothetical protein
MLQLQAHVTEERVRKSRVSANALTADPNGPSKGQDIGGTAVGKFTGLQIAPEQFDGVQIGSVGREPFDMQPGLLGHEVALHAPALVGAEPVPPSLPI